MKHICRDTREQIKDLVGSFEFISFATIVTDEGNKTRYTVRKPSGKKFIHLIRQINGVITKC